MTHLVRSTADDNVYSSGGDRKEKRRLFYFLIGKSIKRSVPEVFMKDNLRIFSTKDYKEAHKELIKTDLWFDYFLDEESLEAFDVDFYTRVKRFEDQDYLNSFDFYPLKYEQNFYSPDKGIIWIFITGR